MYNLYFKSLSAEKCEKSFSIFALCSNLPGEEVRKVIFYFRIFHYHIGKRGNYMDWTMFAAITGVIALQTALLLWIISKIDSDVKASTADSSAKWIAANARMDTMINAINQRLDANQSAIIRMLEKQGK